MSIEIFLERYRDAFLHLRKGVTKYGPAPHKLILLLAVIEGIERGEIVEDRIYISDRLVESFKSIWGELIHTGHVATFALPFFHLQGEGFWYLQAKPGRADWLLAQSSVSSLGSLRDAVEFASMDLALFALLSEPKCREILKHTLLDELQRDGYGPLKKVCPFCRVFTPQEIIAENEKALAFYDGFPVNPGHTLIIPRRHVAGYFDLEQKELADIHELTVICRDILQRKYRPHGFNIGVNVGEAAGQSIFHCHVHLIPRYTGDVANPRGGVRGVIPAKQNY